MFETAWQHYRVKPAARAHPETASSSERTAIADYAAAGSAFGPSQEDTSILYSANLLLTTL
jgi:hypothetical protein